MLTFMSCILCVICMQINACLPNNTAIICLCCLLPMAGQSGSSEEEIDVNDQYIDPLAEDRELKGQLLRKYSGCLGNLKQEFLKKKKKGKLPNEARQQLLDWWSRHNKWPYPSVHINTFHPSLFTTFYA